MTAFLTAQRRMILLGLLDTTLCHTMHLPEQTEILRISSVSVESSSSFVLPDDSSAWPLDDEGTSVIQRDREVSGDNSPSKYTQPDQYGQVHLLKETEQLIETKLKEFDQAVSVALSKDSCSKRHTALQDGTSKCPELLTVDFKLRFLRCQLFDIDTAVRRYAHYWKKRVDIFGPIKAFEPLSVADDMVALRIGLLRVVPVPGPDGRAIVYIDPSLQDKSKYTRSSMVRAIWYTLEKILENSITAQRTGVIFISNPSKAKMCQFDRKLDQQLASITQGAMPVRFSCLHICHAPPSAQIIVPIIKVFLSERLKKRIQMHSGNMCLKELAKYGLHREMLPIELGGEVELDHEAWIAGIEN